MRRYLLGLIALGVCGPAVLAKDDFPQFRGPGGIGAIGKADLPLDWSSDKNIAWKVKVPGAGWSQPVIVGERLFVTSAVSDPQIKPMNFMDGYNNPPKPGAKAPDVVMEWQIHCLDPKSGKILWTQTAAKGKPKYPVHPSNTYATETPAADAKAVYAFFGTTGALAAYDHSGKLLWTQDLCTYTTKQDLGTGSSVVLADGRLFVQHYTEEKAFVACFDTKDGKELWRAERDQPATSWATPLVWRNRLRTELVVLGQNLVTSHDPQTGAELWRMDYPDSPFMTSPTADADRLYFGGGLQTKVGPLCAMKPGAKGNVSMKPGEAGSEFLIWSVRGGGASLTSPVVSNGLVYVQSQSVLACYDAKTGENKYKERLPDLRVVTANPIVLEDRVVVLDEAGFGVTVKSGAAFQILGAAKLDDLFWATPAIAGDALYLRGVEYLYCIRKS